MFIRNAWKRIRPRCYVVYSAHKRCMSQEAHKSKFYPFQASAPSTFYYWFMLICRIVNTKHQKKESIDKKWDNSRKQSTPNFLKNEHLFPPDTHTCVCVSGGKKCSFFGKFGMLCFRVTPVLRFALFPYYRRIIALFEGDLYFHDVF